MSLRNAWSTESDGVVIALYAIFHLTSTLHHKHYILIRKLTLSLSRSYWKFSLLCAKYFFSNQFQETSAGSIKNSVVDIFLSFHHVFAWYCISILRRNCVLVKKIGDFRCKFNLQRFLWQAKAAINGCSSKPLKFLFLL